MTLQACDYRMKRGWRCTRYRHHTGPCALVPKYWNLIGQLWETRRW